MKIDTTIILIIIVVVFIVIIASQRCTFRCTRPENFGQDASIRVQSGWLAGPKGMYGYDPIDEFAEQIEQMKARNKTPLWG